MARTRPSIPAPVDRTYTPFDLPEPGTWLVLSDVHLPYHDRKTVESATKTAQKNRVAGVLLNGDIMDAHGLSSFDKDPSAPRYIAEVEAAKGLLTYIRDRLPQARIVYKEGNHEERLPRHLMRHSPALCGLPSVTIPSILDFGKYDVEWVGDRRVIRLGRLNVIHGHEYRSTIQAPVNPARGLFLRAKSTALCGHFHQTSEHHEPDITGKAKGCWSTGCACQLSPAYSPLNKWNHGFALVEVAKGGAFSVRNFRVMDGEVV